MQFKTTQNINNMENHFDITNITNDFTNKYTLNNITEFLNMDIEIDICEIFNKYNIFEYYVINNDEEIFIFDNNIEDTSYYLLMFYISHQELFNKIVKIPINFILFHNKNKDPELVIKIYKYINNLHNYYKSFSEDYITTNLLMVGNDECSESIL
jgi:hypothetical protein